MGEDYSSGSIYVQNVPDLGPEETWREHFQDRIGSGDMEYVLEALNSLHEEKEEGLNYLEIHFLLEALESFEEVPSKYGNLHSSYLEDEDDDISSWG